MADAEIVNAYATRKQYTESLHGFLRVQGITNMLMVKWVRKVKDAYSLG